MRSLTNQLQVHCCMHRVNCGNSFDVIRDAEHSSILTVEQWQRLTWLKGIGPPKKSIGW